MWIPFAWHVLLLVIFSMKIRMKYDELAKSACNFAQLHGFFYWWSWNLGKALSKLISINMQIFVRHIVRTNCNVRFVETSNKLLRAEWFILKCKAVTMVLGFFNIYSMVDYKVTWFFGLCWNNQFSTKVFFLSCFYWCIPNRFSQKDTQAR